MQKVQSQVSPFNESRFDACMAYIAARRKTALDQYDMVKLHVLIDTFHVLNYGRTVIGGKLEAWRHGPVVRPAYERIQEWTREFDHTGAEPERLRLVEKKGTVKRFEAAAPADPDDFTPSELKAMDYAWATLEALPDMAECRRYFHHKKTAIGRAWKSARNNGTALDWNLVIDAHDELKGENHAHVKALISM